MNPSDHTTIHEDRDQLHYEMVLKSYRKKRDSGELESVQEIFNRLPLPRLDKDCYTFQFDNVKSNIEGILARQNILEQMQKNQQASIKKIEVRNFKDVKFLNEDAVINQRLTSGLPIFKSITYIRSQDEKNFEEHEGDDFPFLPDQKYIDLNRIDVDITNTKLFLQDSQPLKAYKFQFLDENTIDFMTRGFPTTYEIEKRAQTLAKLYILNLYREQSRKMKQLNKLDEIELNHQRQIKKIKQELDIQKQKEGQLIDQKELFKQGIKILQLIKNKMNQMAYDEYDKKKNGQRAMQIKKSLQKLQENFYNEPSPIVKLRMLILYKHKKGW